MAERRETRFRLYQVLALCFLLLVGPPAFGNGAPSNGARHAPDHVLIKFKAEAQGQFRALRSTNRLVTLVEQLGLPPGARLTEPRVTELLRQRRPELGSPTPNLDRFLYLSLPPGMSVEACVNRLKNHPLLDFVEPDGVGSCGAIIPNDPDF